MRLNIFNILLTLGISAEISPIRYNLALNFDLLVFGLGSFKERSLVS
jgi:hypothetical protein